MFKPHFGTCICHSEERLIVVKAGYCAEGNHNQKLAKKKALGKPLPKQYIKKTTGEKDIFEVVLDRYEDTPIHCFVCNKKLTLITHHNFAHILRKGLYPKFRLNPDNIQILCYNIEGTGCHTKFDFNPRSEIIDKPEWKPILELEQKLKKEYKLL